MSKPTDKIVWSGKTSSYHHKIHDTPNPPTVRPAIRKQWVLDAQWTDCPIEVYNEVKQIWINDDELHNDICIAKRTLEYFFECVDEKGNYMFPAIIQYLQEQIPDLGLEDDIWIHFWW